METIDTEAEDRQDMERLAAGSDSALDALMERHAGPVFQFLQRLLADEQDANDLAQETFVRVYRHRERYDGGKFTTWLYTIAGNLARNEYRRRSRHPNVSLEVENETNGGSLVDLLPSAELGPAETALALERQDAVQKAVQKLPEELKEAIILCEWEDMSAAEAATVLNTTTRGVESRLYRARKLLKKRLKKWIS